MTRASPMNMDGNGHDTLTKQPQKLLQMPHINAPAKRQLLNVLLDTNLAYKSWSILCTALKLDCLNRNTKWHCALQLKINQLLKFNMLLICNKGGINLKDYTYVPLLMVFDVKFDRQHKCCYVTNGSVTGDLGDEIYSSVVGIDSLQIALLLAQLNGLQVCAGDVSCAFLQLQCKEKIYTIDGPRIWSQTTRESPHHEKEHLPDYNQQVQILPQTLCMGTLQDWIQTITHRPRPMDERLPDTLQVHLNLGGRYSCHVQGTAQSDPRIQGGRGVQTQRSQGTQILPWEQPTSTQGWQLHLLWDSCQDLNYLHHWQDWEAHGMVTQKLHVTGRSKLLSRTWQNTTSGTRTTLTVQDDHRKLKLASHTWMLWHLPHSLNYGTVWDGAMRRTPKCNKVHPWLPTSLSKDINLVQHTNAWLQRVQDAELWLILQLPRSTRSNTAQHAQTMWATSQNLGLLQCKPCELSQDTAFSDRHPTLHQQVQFTGIVNTRTQLKHWPMDQNLLQDR